ncbi:MAG: hypothetical protein C0503_10225 [Gemmatimonas sp.]|nr:hypothetical protein [Gemmatimonas sp.]
MNVLDLHAAALSAVASNPSRPATAVVHDAPGLRLVVFRIEPGQQVAPHTSEATVLLTVISGRGTISGPDGETTAEPGSAVAYAPGELHGMRADAERFCVLASIVRKH